jgi:hypothetical protein
MSECGEAIGHRIDVDELIAQGEYLDVGLNQVYKELLGGGQREVGILPATEKENTVKQ